MKPEYSVIIPVYNAEKTICRCVDSLIKPKREDVEIILINDGSTDGSGAICERYAAENPQIKYISKENGGVSSARNAGIEAAEGKYVAFVDSDDYVTEDFFGTMDGVLSEFDYDYARFLKSFNDGKKTVLGIAENFTATTRKEAFPKIIDDICRKTINGPVAKVYKSEIIKNYGILFPEGVSISEDRAFNIAYSTHVKSYSVSDKLVYCINTENKNSLSRKKQADLADQLEATSEYAKNAVKNANITDGEKEQYLAAMNFGTCGGIYKTAKDLHRDKVPFFKRLAAIHKQCRKINRQKLKYPKTRYCRLITLPVRLNLALVIDAMAWVLIRR